MRYYYLDFARGLLMSIGVVIHTTQVFMVNENWLLVSNNVNIVFNYLYIFIHSFRMEAFYIISGFFSIMLIEKYGIKMLLHNRLIRLGVPLIFVGVVINSLMYIYAPNVNFKLFGVSYWLGGRWLSFLWFIGNLLGYVFLQFIVFKFWGSSVIKFLKKRTYYPIFVFSVAITVMLFKRIEWRLPDPMFEKCWIIFHQKRFFLYFPYYLTGIIFYINKHLFKDFIDRYILNFLITLIAFLFKYSLIGFPIKYNIYITEFLSYSIGISFTGLLFKLFKLFFDKPNKLQQSLSDASYTIYVLHQPLIIVFGYYVLKAPIHYMWQFFIIIAFAWYIPYIFHLYIVKKYSLIGLLLNGKNYTKKKNSKCFRL